MLVLTNVNADKVKGKRNWADRSQYIQLHQTDYDPVRFENMLTNYGVSLDDRAILVHPVSDVIDHNYNDFCHIEVGGVYRGIEGNDKTGNATVVYNGKTYHRTLRTMTDAKEAALEECILHAVAEYRSHGIEPCIITHRQTYAQRTYDPGEAIARAGWRIAARHCLRLDYQFVRGSGKACPVEWMRG